MIFASITYADEPLRIGVASMITPVDAVRYYQEIIDYIGEELGEPVQMVHRRSYEEMDRLLERGEVKVAFICSYPYVKDREAFGIELLAVPKVDNRTTYHSYIIVHKDSPVKSFAELKGKAFAFTDPRSNSGRLYPLYLLKTMGTTPERFFKKVIYSYSHNKSIELVAKKKVDGVVVTRDMRPELRERVRNILLNMHRTDRGRRILDAMLIDSFVRGSDSAYDSIREMDRVLRGEKKNDRQAVQKRKTFLFFQVIMVRGSHSQRSP